MYRKISILAGSILIAAALLGYMLMQAWDELLSVLDHLQPMYLAFAVGICLGAWLLRGVRYQKILRSLEVSISTGFSIGCIFISQTANLIVPARIGDFIRMLILRHEDRAPYSRGLSSLVVERVFDIITIAILGVLAIPFVLNVPFYFLVVIGIGLAAGAVFFIAIALTGTRSHPNRYIAFLFATLDEVRAASLNVGSIITFTTISIVIWLFDVLVCVGVVRMLALEIAFPLILLAIVIGNLAKAVPITPGGLGTYEAVMATALALGGIAPEAAILVAIIDHLIKNLVTAIGGAVSSYYFGNWVLPLVKQALAKNFGGGDTVRD
jgi:glycosyltransferase AglD